VAGHLGLLPAGEVVEDFLTLLLNPFFQGGDIIG